MKVVALSGGIGGAKLAAGLARIVPADQLMLVANTGDDFVHLGLHVSPDIDTLLYTLSGKGDPVRGWGRAGETWSFMAALRELNAEDWFLLGDKDLAIHVLRTQALRDGASLSEVTETLASRLGIKVRVCPMSDDPVRTTIRSEQGLLPFQEYFVRLRCKPRVQGIQFDHCTRATPSAAMMQALGNPDLSAVILCPSNPYLSVNPILSIPGVRRALKACAAPVVAVSPIVGGQSLKGPTAKIMSELGQDVSARTVAEGYADFLDGFLIDRADRALIPELEAMGVSVNAADIVMQSEEQKIEVARKVLAFAGRLDRR